MSTIDVFRSALRYLARGATLLGLAMHCTVASEDENENESGNGNGNGKENESQNEDGDALSPDERLWLAELSSTEH